MRKKRNLATLVGGNIARIRYEKKLNQAELAERLNIGTDSLSRIENGVVAPRYDRLEEIAAILGCNVAEFFYTPDDPIHAKLVPLGALLNALPEEKADAYIDIFKRMILLGE